MNEYNQPPDSQYDDSDYQDLPEQEQPYENDQGPYDQQVYYQQPLEPHRGATILTLGILGLVCCVICGIIAWVMGNTDLQAMADGRMDPTGQGMTQAGKICGMVSCILALIALVVQIIFFAIGAGMATM